MSNCVTHKRMYATRELALDALIDAHKRFDYQRQQGPVAIYRCDDCGQYHFTSQGKMDEALERYISSGKIRLDKEANRWIDKFKKS